MDLRYRIPQDVRVASVTPRVILSTPQGGKIALDAALLSLWKYADGKALNDIVANFRLQGSTRASIRAALACLSEAGLLIREGKIPEPHTFESVNGALVSAVIVNHDSQEWLDICLTALACQNYSPLEIIVVDNASSADPSDWLREKYPQVRLLHLEILQSLSRAINQGVALANGEFFLLLNPDARPQTDAVSEMVAIAKDDSTCAAVAAKLRFSWAPAFLNGIGNHVGAFSWGTDNALGHLDLGQFDSWSHVPSACFAAALIPRHAWRHVGQVDENFSLYYEDSEWSYRARLLGRTVRAAPHAIVYHTLGQRVPSGDESGLSPKKLRRVVCGRLRFALKIAGTSFLARFLPGYFFEDLANVFRAAIGRDGASIHAYLGGWFDFFKNLTLILRERKKLQSRRSRSDAELFGLQKMVPSPLIWHGLPELTWDLVVHRYMHLIRSGTTRPLPEPKAKLLIVSHDVVDTKMAGPGIRYLEIARALSSDLDVTLAIPSETSLRVPEVCLVCYRPERPELLKALVAQSDVVLISAYLLEKLPFLQSTHARLVIDLYDPFILENLHYYRNEPISAQEILHRQAVAFTNRLVYAGDFFICGSERQRNFWLGVLSANNRINPRTFSQDPSLRALIDVVGVGFPDREPRRRAMLRGAHSAFPNDARIVLWGGGIWDWMDPLTLIHAWRQVIVQHPDARLVFLGTRHPNPNVPRHKMAEHAESLAEEIGEKNRTIFFYEWMSYEDREALLCEADVGVSLHTTHIETRYSIRTRVLDYFWARLPVVVTDGDITSEWVRRYGVGKIVAPSDESAVARALSELLEKHKENWETAFEPLRKVFCWTDVVEPLRHYCLEGRRAPDREARNSISTETNRVQTWRARLARARYIWKTEGWRALLHRAWRYAQWYLARI